MGIRLEFESVFIDLSLAAAALPLGILLIGGFSWLIPWNSLGLSAGLGLFLLLGPGLFFLPLHQTRPWRRPAAFVPFYLAALVLVAIAAGFILELQRQLTPLRFPLEVKNPTSLTVWGIGIYLPITVFISILLSRWRPSLFYKKQALLTSGAGIRLPSPALLSPSVLRPAPIGPAFPASSPTAGRPRNELTFEEGNGIKNHPFGGFSQKNAMETPDSALFKQTLDHFAQLTHLSVLAFNAQSELLWEPSLENSICRTVQQSPQGRNHCHHHCGRSIGTALQGQDPFFFKCDMNLHVFSVPMILDEKRRWVFQGGKAYFSREEFALAAPAAAALGVGPDALRSLETSIRITDHTVLADSARFLGTTLPALFSSTQEKEALKNRFSRLISLFMLTSELEEDPNQIPHTLLNILGILFNLNTALLMDRDPKSPHFSVSAVFGQKADLLRNFRTDGQNSLIHGMTEKQAPVSTGETLEILRAGFPSGLGSVHLIPAGFRDGRLLSFLCIVDSPLSEEDLRIIGQFCRQVDLIRDNGLLRMERKGLAKDISILLEIAKTVGSALDLDDLSSIILEKSTQFLQAEQGSLMLLDEERQELTVKAMKGLNKKIVELLKIQPGEGISGRVLATGSPLVVADVEHDERVPQRKRPRYKTNSFISIPLKLDERTIGVLNIADKITGDIFREEDLNLLTSIGAYASVAIQRSRYYEKSEELKRISITDSLTSLLNRRYFQERMSEEIERSRRHRLPLSLIMIDLDDFKSVNDTLGHLVGDEVLKIAARCIRNSIRTIDVAARYGGEEFTVILPQTGKTDAQIIAERICAEVRHLDFPFTQSEPKLSLSVSLGLATFPEDAETIEELIRNADLALYAAKSQGKNRVVLFGR